MDLEHFPPNVDRSLTGRFQLHKKVSVFDDNLFNIDEGLVRTVTGDRIHIRYPTRPAEDDWVPNNRVFAVSRKNTIVFKQQEGVNAVATNDSVSAEESSDIVEKHDDEAPPPEKP
jgi:hypothetical protein